MASPNDRSDVAERRAQLRSLDIALCDEFEDAGALTFQALRDQVISRNLLYAPVTDESLWEWWHYAQRRQIIEPGAIANEMTLSDRGRVRLVEAHRAAALPSAPKARAVMRYLIPPGLTGLLAAGAVGVLSKSAAVAIGAAAIILVVLLYWLLAEVVDYLFAKQIDPKILHARLKTAVAWLDGDQVRWLGRTVHDAADKRSIRRLNVPSLPPLPPESERRHKPRVIVAL
jgi:hypothetical protein